MSQPHTCTFVHAPSSTSSKAFMFYVFEATYERALKPKSEFISAPCCVGITRGITESFNWHAANDH